MDDFSNLAKMSLKPVVHGHLFWYALQVSAWWQTLLSLTEEKVVGNDVEGNKHEIKEQEMFQLGRTPLFYTQAPLHFQ